MMPQSEAAVDRHPVMWQPVGMKCAICGEPIPLARVQIYGTRTKTCGPACSSAWRRKRNAQTAKRARDRRRDERTA